MQSILLFIHSLINKMKKIIIILISFVVTLSLAAEITLDTQTNLNGKITDNKWEPLTGVSIYLPELKTGAITNAVGNYKISNLPKRNILVQVSAVGYKMIVQNIDLVSTAQKDFVMEEAVI